MKLQENRFFKPTVIHLTLNSANSAKSPESNNDNRAVTENIEARSETGRYDEVRTDSEANTWSPLSFMQWFTKENKEKHTGADNMEVMKYEEDNNNKLYSDKTDPASKITDKISERGSEQKRIDD
jgi:hypothetical protein